MWKTWTAGRRDWDLGPIVPDEVLYYLNGPAIFTCRIGLETILFFKSDEIADSDYFLAAPIEKRELDALKAGRLSVRGALSRPRCWLFEFDLHLQVQRYEQRAETDVRAFLPKPGVPLLGSFGTAADSIAQTDSLFAFKFYGAEMSEEGMPFSTFKNLVDDVYNVVRNALTPLSLGQGRDRRFMDFPVRQPEFASLLIAIDAPILDAEQLRARDRTRHLDPEAVVEEAQERGRDFADQVERTIDLARAGQLSQQYASDNFSFLQQIVEILPASDSEVSKLQFSSNSTAGQIFVEVDSTAGDRIRQSVQIVERRDVHISGMVTAVLWKTKTIRVQTEYSREVTCELGTRIFEELLAARRLTIGARIGLSGRYVSRDYRDYMKVHGAPNFY